MTRLVNESTANLQKKKMLFDKALEQNTRGLRAKGERADKMQRGLKDKISNSIKEEGAGKEA